jgi:hypothetical protein
VIENISISAAENAIVTSTNGCMVALQDENLRIAKSVVWTPIPVLSWLCPAIGHVGVTDSRGVTYDFEGPFTIGRGRMIFGDPRQRWPIAVDDRLWDKAISEVSEEFASVNYSLLCSNCHFFAASVLDRVGYRAVAPFSGQWANGATVKIIWGLMLHGRTLTARDAVVIWLPFLALAALAILAKR